MRIKLTYPQLKLKLRLTLRLREAIKKKKLRNFGHCPKPQCPPPPLGWYGRKKYGRLDTESSASVLFLHRDITVRDIYEVKAYRDVTVT